jgi:hypothetical protein
MRLLAGVIVVLALAGVAWAGHEGSVSTVPDGGAAGGDALYLPRGDILNVRNIQGGVIGDPNLDIGAGSTEHPGSLVLNYDVGRCTVIFDGLKNPLARFCPGGITFFVRPRVKRRRVALVPRAGRGVR